MLFVGGLDGQVWVVRDDGVPSRLGEFEWGGTGPACAALAKTLLSELYSPMQAVKLHRLYMHRTIAHWPKDQDWAQTDLDISDVVNSILEVQKEMASDVAKMKREAPRGVQREAGHPAFGPSRWGSERTGYRGEEPTIERKDPREAKYRPSIHDNAPLKR